MTETIHLPMIPEPPTRERLAELRRVRARLVKMPIVPLKTYSGLKHIEELLTQKIKLEESDPNHPNNPNNPNAPRGPRKTQTKGDGGKTVA